MAKKTQFEIDREHIHESMDNALANGNDPRDLTVTENVGSLGLYDWYAENLTVEDIYAHVIAWMEKHNA